MSFFSSLVADYGSGNSSSSSESVSSEDETEIKNNLKTEVKEENAIKLPPPAFGGGTEHSVFSNPFVEAEKAKKAMLEKHVKMTPSREETTMINGKKICWSYRKGRCRFGHNCKFAHDSDLHKTTEELINDNLPEQEILAQNVTSTSSSAFIGDSKSPLTVDSTTNKKKNKRPGLGDSIVPSKKVMKMYKKAKQ